MYRSFGKRTLDICLSASALLFLSPILLVIAISVWLTHGSPILFRQTRPGYKGAEFVVNKFRTMTNNTDETGRLLPDAERLTRLGKFLRATSLDELPELWNVLRGEMSLVGPRPLLTDYLEHYSEEQQRRHDVQPGITGLAQIRGRQLIPFSERIEYDLCYVKNLSLWLDIKILFTTAVQIFHRRGVILGQDVSEVDDLGLSRGSSNKH